MINLGLFSAIFGAITGLILISPLFLIIFILKRLFFISLNIWDFIFIKIRVPQFIKFKKNILV